MILRLLAVMWLFRVSLVCARRGEMERYHAPIFFKEPLPDVVDKATDTKRPNLKHTPDFRIEQTRLEPWTLNKKLVETHRPYRMSPHFKIANLMNDFKFPHVFACYCTTVYRLHRLLAGCAVLSKRHIVTSATATELVLRKHRKAKNLDKILGVWYDIKSETFNSSRLAVPARIHYHPLFTMPHRVNRTHPFSVMWDVAIWTTTYSLNGDSQICPRAGPYKDDLNPAIIDWGAEYYMFGYQFMKAYSRRPQPWYKYMVKVEAAESREYPCPKVEWGWFRCMKTESFAPLGLDIGAPLHRITYPSRSRWTGLIGLNLINLKLRSRQITSYFNDLNIHKNLDFIYDAYIGKLNYVYLDSRYEDNFRDHPQLKKGESSWNPNDIPIMHNYRSVRCCWNEEDRPGYG